ncbi:MAG: oligosaccharide flippase family protein, partial [Ignavibacteria bacterium]|nr:oligosaccharide flippase family protein [Ignavibacteria bacterium]
MEVFETKASSSSGKIIAKNTIYNLFGYGIPIIFALALMPPLIHGLGKERFGILSLVWMVIGYFSFLDLGIGRSLTKVIAEKIGLKETEQIPIIFWSALLLMFLISVLVSVISIFFVPSLLNQYLKISEALKHETYKIFFVVSLSIPLITTSAGLRGVLEAYQQFNKVSYIRIILGVSTFLIPLIVLRLTNSLFWIVISLISIRLI